MADGLTSTGFVIRTQAQIQANIEATQLALISPSLNLQAPDPIAVTNGIVSAEIAKVWELCGAMYNGTNRDGATGDQLTNVMLLTGTLRQPASKAQVPGVHLTVGAAFDAAAGTMFASMTGQPALLFVNKTRIYSLAGGAITTDAVGNSINFEAVDAGPTSTIAANALVVIAVPLAGWTVITNPTAGTPGQGIQNDASGRAMAEAELSQAGTGTAAALRGRILATLQTANNPVTFPEAQGSFNVSANVTSALVLFNDTDVTDGNGIPPHSIEAIVFVDGGSPTVDDDSALAALILSDKSAGIGTYSGAAAPSSALATDTQGQTRTIYFSRPAPLAENITITVVLPTGTPDPTKAIKAAMYAFAAGDPTAQPPILPSLGPGVEAYAERFKALAYVGGVLNVTAFAFSAPNDGANVRPSVREFVELGTIVVTLVHI